MDKYKNNLLNYSSKLDALSDSYGKIIKLATTIVEENNNDAAVELLKQIAEITKKENSSVPIRQVSKAVKESLIDYYGYQQIVKFCREEIYNTDTRTLPELLDELNELIGLKKVKQKVNDLIVYQQVQKMRAENGLHSVKNTMHLAFTGNPGTGKTTVARIVGRIYKKLGLLSKGHFMEVSRTDLIAGYQGQTALKVKKVIEQARGGVLFIDEAYSITENDHSDSYGRECLTELTKALEDYRDDLVVIVAGYTEPMNKFFESNPGLKSRFNNFIEFDDYTVDELWSILNGICRKNDYVLDEGISEKIKSTLVAELKKNNNFSNGRFMRNIYDDIVINHAKRVIKEHNPSKEILSLLTVDDFETPDGQVPMCDILKGKNEIC